MMHEPILDLGRRWADAERRADVVAIGPRGFVLNRQQWLDRYRAGDVKNDALSWQDVSVRDYGEAAVAIGIQTPPAAYQGHDPSGRFRVTQVAAQPAGRGPAGRQPPDPPAAKEGAWTMRQTIRLFLLLEGASFVVAGLVHFGVLVDGYEHRQAAIAESSIAVVLLVGLGLTWLWPGRARPIGLAAQALALLGTLVGAFTIAVGVGPRTVPDIAYHVAILVALAWGLVVAARAPADGARQHA